MTEIKTCSFPSLSPRYDQQLGVIELFHSKVEARRATIRAGKRRGYTLASGGVMRSGDGSAAVMVQ